MPQIKLICGAFSSQSRALKTVLVCDTGQLSRVGAAVMAEGGFMHVYSIKGGMRRWNRWMIIDRMQLFAKIEACCTRLLY